MNRWRGNSHWRPTGTLIRRAEDSVQLTAHESCIKDIVPNAGVDGQQDARGAAESGESRIDCRPGQSSVVGTENPLSRASCVKSARITRISDKAADASTWQPPTPRNRSKGVPSVGAKVNAWQRARICGGKHYISPIECRGHDAGDALSRERGFTQYRPRFPTVRRPSHPKAGT